MKAVIAGTGSFAEKLHHVLFRYDVDVVAFIDEFRTEECFGKPVFPAATAPVAALNDPDTCLFVAISADEFSQAAEQRLVARGGEQGRILRLENDSALLILEQMFESSFGKFQSLLARNQGGFLALERAFFAGPEEVPARVSFRIFNRGKGFLSHLDELPARIANRHTVNLLSDEELENREFAFCSQQRALALPADLVISPQTYPCSPQATPKLTLIHALYDSLMLRDSIAGALAQPGRHYLGIASRASFRQFQDICLQNNLTNVVLIPAGYPKLDTAIREYRPLPGTTQRTLLYAPTQCVTRKSGAGAVYSIDDSLALVVALLADDPDLNIIFRPHPEDLSLVRSGLVTETSAIMKELIRWADGHPRFALDANPGQKQSYAKADILLTDTSSTAFSFSFGTENPVIFYSPDDTDLIARAGHFEFISDRPQVGQVCQNTGQVLDAYLDMAARPGAYAASIRTLREHSVFNLGRSLSYYERAVDLILENSQLDSWWSLSSETILREAAP